MKKETIYFAAAFTASALALRSAPAFAAYVREHAATCQQDTFNTPGNLSLSSLYSGYWRVLTGVGYLICPIQDTSALPHGNIVTFVVDIYNPPSGSGYSAAQGCVTYGWGGGGFCGSGASTTAYGHTSLSPTISAFHGYPNDVPYVNVELSGAGTYMTGIYISNP